MDCCYFFPRCLIPTSCLSRPKAIYFDTSHRNGERTSVPFLSSLSLGHTFGFSWHLPNQLFSSCLPFLFSHAPDNLCCPTIPYFLYWPFCWWSASHRIVYARHRGWWTWWTNGTFSGTVENKEKPGKGDILKCDSLSPVFKGLALPSLTLPLCVNPLLLHSVLLFSSVSYKLFFVIRTETFTAETCCLLCGCTDPFCLFHVHAFEIKLSVFEM